MNTKLHDKFQKYCAKKIKERKDKLEGGIWRQHGHGTPGAAQHTNAALLRRFAFGKFRPRVSLANEAAKRRQERYYAMTSERNRWLGLLKRTLTGGAGSVAARSAIFGALQWEKGGRVVV